MSACTVVRTHVFVSCGSRCNIPVNFHHHLRTLRHGICTVTSIFKCVVYKNKLGFFGEVIMLHLKGGWGNVAHRVIPPTLLFRKTILDDQLTIPSGDDIATC